MNMTIMSYFNILVYLNESECNQGDICTIFTKVKRITCDYTRDEISSLFCLIFSATCNALHMFKNLGDTAHIQHVLMHS